MRIALLQTNPVVGAIEANCGHIAEAVRQAASTADIDLCVAPELAVTGYPPRDLLLYDDFVSRAERALVRLAEELTGAPPLLVGSPFREDGLLYNGACLLHGGGVRKRMGKRLLPVYDIFDEPRYFAPGEGPQVVEVGTHRVLVTVCEDIWAGRDVLSDADAGARYAADPLSDQDFGPLDGVVNLSASPFVAGKHHRRMEILARAARLTGAPVAFVNQVGGNDELVFDGNSCVVDGAGALLAHARAFAEDIPVVDTTASAPVPPIRPETDTVTLMRQALITGVADYARKTGFSRAMVALSGGIDSALTAAIAAEALGPQNVTGVLMPSPYSSDGSVIDAAELAAVLGMETHTLPIGPLMDCFDTALADPLTQYPAGENDVTPENIQSRIRGTLVMALANRMGALALSTGNKSELAVGYCTLYGDMAGGLAVLADVYKTDVYKLARTFSAIPENSIRKPPSAELRHGQKDTDTLPDYATLDAILRAHIEETQDEASMVRAGHDPAVVEHVLTMVRRNEFKRRQNAPGIKLSARAFGTGWRLPVAKR